MLIATLPLIAQEKTDLQQIIKGLGPLGGETSDLTSKCNSVILLATTLSSVIGLITILSFLWFTFQMAIAAIQWIASGGEKAAVQTAQQKITHSVFGLALSVAGIFIVILISNILGIGSFLNLPTVVPTLIPGGGNPCK